MFRSCNIRRLPLIHIQFFRADAMKNRPHSRGAVAAYLGRITVTGHDTITDRGDSARGLWPVTVTIDGIVKIRAKIERRGDDCHVAMPCCGFGMPSAAHAVVSITDPDLRAALTIAAYDYVIQYEADEQAQYRAGQQRRSDQMMAARDKAAA